MSKCLNVLAVPSVHLMSQGNITWAQCCTSDHWVAGSNPCMKCFTLISPHCPYSSLTRFSLRNVHTLGLKHHFNFHFRGTFQISILTRYCKTYHQGRNLVYTIEAITSVFCALHNLQQFPIPQCNSKPLSFRKTSPQKFSGYYSIFMISYWEYEFKKYNSMFKKLIWIYHIICCIRTTLSFSYILNISFHVNVWVGCMSVTLFITVDICTISFVA